MSEYSATWVELNEVWPWRQVLEFYERILEARFYSAYPACDNMALTINMNRRRGAPPIKTLSIMPDFLLPLALRDASRGKAIYSEAVVDAFEAFMRDGYGTNGLLAALNTKDLRASGWSG